MKKLVSLVVVCFFAQFVFAEISTTVVTQPNQSQIEKQPQQDPFQENLNKLQSNDPAVRRQAAENLGRARRVEAIPYLIKLLKDPDQFVRSTTVDSLGLLRAKEAADEISNLLVKDESSQVRQSAAIALGYINERKVIPNLIKGLDDKEIGIKFACIQTLGILRSSEAVPVFLKYLKEDDVNLKRSVLNALGMIGNTSILADIRNILNDKDPNVRAEAIRVINTLNDQDSTQKLIELLKDQDSRVRTMAAVTLAKFGNNSGLSVAKIEIENKDSIIRIQALQTIDLIGDKTCIPLLTQLLNKEQDPFIKQRIQQTLNILKTKYPPETPSKSIKKKK